MFLVTSDPCYIFSEVHNRSDCLVNIWKQYCQSNSQYNPVYNTNSYEMFQWSTFNGMKNTLQNIASKALQGDDFSIQFCLSKCKYNILCNQNIWQLKSSINIHKKYKYLHKRFTIR